MKRLLGILAVALLVAAGAYAALHETDRSRKERVEVVASCDVRHEYLLRLWRGYVPYRSGDVLLAERPPNQFGKRHASPFPYVQDVPLALYGPGFVRPGRFRRPVTIADIAPTLAELLHFDEFPERDGQVLEEALLPRAERNGVPKLIVTLVWDGGGDNLLDMYPDSWPYFKRLLTTSGDYANATIGSSPTITPTAHMTIGSGSFPKAHGLPDGLMRVKGRIVDPFEDASPKYMRVKTLADLYDPAHANLPLVGMLARDTWHLGMIGHGAYLPEGDKDIAVMDTHGHGTDFRTNPLYYELPEYLLKNSGLTEAIAVVDERDGELDGTWLGNEILSVDDAKVRYTPAWSIYQTQRSFELLEKEGFGRDEVPDLFFTNYKAVDLASHEWSMVEPEQRENLEEADRQLQVLVEGLDDLVGRKNYVLVITADHGLQAPPEATGGWPIFVPELTRDIHSRFDSTNPNRPLVMGNRGWSITLSKEELEANGVTPADISAYARNYTLADNLKPGAQMPPRFEGRGREKVFLTALTPEELEDALACASRKRPAGETQSLGARKQSRTTRATNSGLPRR